MVNLLNDLFKWRDQIFEIERFYQYTLETYPDPLIDFQQLLKDRSDQLSKSLLSVYYAIFPPLLTKQLDSTPPQSLPLITRLAIWGRVFDQLTDFASPPKIYYPCRVSHHTKGKKRELDHIWLEVNLNQTSLVHSLSFSLPLSYLTLLRRWGIGFMLSRVDTDHKETAHQEVLSEELRLLEMSDVLSQTARSIQTISRHITHDLTFLSSTSEGCTSEGFAFEEMITLLLCTPHQALKQISSEYKGLFARHSPSPLKASSAPLEVDLLGGGDLSITRLTPSRARGWLQVSLTVDPTLNAKKEKRRHASGCFWSLSPLTLAQDCPPEHPIWRHASHTPATLQGRAYIIRQWFITALHNRHSHLFGPIASLPPPLAWQILCSIHERIGRPVRKKMRRFKQAPLRQLDGAQLDEGSA